jgi:hypothetical protein
MSGGWKWDEGAQPNNELRLFYKSEPIRSPGDQPDEIHYGYQW